MRVVRHNRFSDVLGVSGSSLRIDVQLLIERLLLKQDLLTPPEDLRAEAVSQQHKPPSDPLRLRKCTKARFSERVISGAKIQT